MLNLETIETSRLILTGLSPADMSYMFENLPKPDIKKMLGHRSEEAYQREENKYKNGYSCYNRSFKLFLLTDKESGAVIGRCGIHNWNAEHRRGEIGYSMEDEAYRKKGLMSEALGAVLAYGFGHLNLHRIEALVGTENIPSLKLMEKYNFVREGLLRQHYYVAGVFEDSVVFSLLRQDYEV